MVQSETFVSRRKKRAERRAPRKLFTARGLVGGETDGANPLSLSRYSEENDSVHADEPKATMSKQQLACMNNGKMRRNHEMITKCDEIREQSSYDSEGDEFSRSSSLGNSLDEVMQMGCMDSLFFSGAMNKTRPSIFPLQHSKRSVEAFLTLPLPKLSFMKYDEVQASYVQSNETKIRSRLDCHLPYQHITDQVAEARLLTTIRGGVFGFDRRNKRTPHHEISYPMKGEMMGYHERNPPPIYRRHIDFPTLPIESPPSQIFIGEQPCLSDELIPVDDVPFPGDQCNLTKYHPKPLTIRQNYAFGKPMLSVDSEESDPPSEVSGKKIMSERNEWHSATTLGGEANVGTSPFDDKSYPSFDETYPCSVDRGNNEIKSASFVMALNAEVGETASNNIRIGLATQFDATNIASTRSVVTGNGSLAGSAATDQAITTEITKKMPISLGTVEFSESEYSPNLSSGGARSQKEPLPQQAMAHALLSKKKSASIASSIDDDNVSNIFIQDENNSPPHISLGVKGTSPGIANKYEPPSVAHSQKSIAIGSHPLGLQNPPYQLPSLAEVRRKPFEVMVAANLPNSPSNFIEDEFFSPKANSPKHRNNSRTNEARLFSFEDSFDESEFFDTMA